MLDAVAQSFKTASRRPGGARFDLTHTTEHVPWIGKLLRRYWPAFNLRSGHPETFIIICLCYTGRKWPDGGSMGIEGPKSDLLLFLSHVHYQHRNETRQFLIFTDFQIEFQDHTGVSGQVSTIPATHHEITTRVGGTMRDLDREDKCVVYYSGHIELEKPLGGAESAYVILRDDERMYDNELRGLFGLSRFPTTTITAIFDACYSGHFLGLPYIHAKGDKRMSRDDSASAEQMKSQVIEISSTTRYQLSFSEKFEGTIHGILTWNLLQYLKIHRQPEMFNLVSHLHGKCATPWEDGTGHAWHQLPSITCSRPIEGRVCLL